MHKGSRHPALGLPNTNVDPGRGPSVECRLTERRGNAFHPPVAGVMALSHPPAGMLLVRVYYEDTDFSGRVYHASYLRFLERGRTEWLRGHGFAHRDLAENSGVVFAVRSLQIEFLAPAMMDDLLEVETSVTAVRGTSIDFKQRVLRSNKE